MALVATLIANPSKANLSPDLAEKARLAVGASTVDWLSEGKACDVLPGTDATKPELAEQLSEALAGAPVDIVIHPIATRRKKALIADMDSTMIDQECIDELAAELGIKEKVAAITAKAMNGEIEFEAAVRERVALLKGLPADIAGKVIANRITFASGGTTMVQTMRANGAYTALVSGGFTTFTSIIAKEIGFHENRANVLEVEGNELAGTVTEPILGAESKVEALLDIARQQLITPEDFVSVGDGANDIPMLNLAGLGVAMHAKPTVAAKARFRIDHGDLTALLYIQGYREEEFVHG